MESISRRKVLMSVGTATGIAALAPIAKASGLCGPLTPAQTEGPFYPRQDQWDKDTDLTSVAGSLEKAQGRVIFVEGLVLDTDCQPISDVFVEIWQACASGRYNHPADPNTAPIDPHFQYWGIARTKADGSYRFKTIYPGAYPADENWMRPPHIHFKVHKWGYKELITQLYFDGEELNEKDLILERIAEPLQELVVRPVFNETVQFNLTLKKGNA